MKVTKKELRERTFIPFQIVIEIESEKEHENLRKSIAAVEAESTRYRMGYRNKERNAVYDLFDKITAHTK
jgi:hypothetical protein